MGLPPEIRLKVYRLVLIRDLDYPDIVIRHRLHGWRIIRRHTWFRLLSDDLVLVPPDCGHIHPQLLLTCHAINTEGSPILYGENTFEQAGQWPQCEDETGCDIQLPITESSPLLPRKRYMITRIRLSNECFDQLDNANELRVFQDFPRMRDLHVDVNGLEPPGDGKPDDYWKERLASIDRHFYWIRRFKLTIRIDYYERDYYVDDDNYPSLIREQAPKPKWDVSSFRKEKERFEKWLADFNVFVGRQTAWTIYFSAFRWDEAPHQVVMMEVTPAPVNENDPPPAILCQIRSDDGRVFNKGSVWVPPTCTKTPEMVEFIVERKAGPIDLVDF